MFSKVKKVISDRILLALGVNPYQSYEKLNWQKFLRFKKILITRDAALVDIIQFIIKVSDSFTILLMSHNVNSSSSSTMRTR